MTSRGWTCLPILAALAPVLMAAGPSVGDRIADGQQPVPAATPAPCQDDSAVLVVTGATGTVLFRCDGAVPGTRPGPWWQDGCAWLEIMPGATLLAVPGWSPEPGRACLIAAPDSGVPAAGRTMGRPTR